MINDSPLEDRGDNKGTGVFFLTAGALQVGFAARPDMLDRSTAVLSIMY